MGAYENHASSTCCADITGNGVIQVADLLAVISAWGGVGAADIAPECGGDGTVNVADLLLVITSWGTCQNPTGYLPQDYFDCEDMCAGLTGEDYWNCMQKCFDVLCANGHPEFCPD